MKASGVRPFLVFVMAVTAGLRCSKSRSAPEPPPMPAATAVPGRQAGEPWRTQAPAAKGALVPDQFKALLAPQSSPTGGAAGTAQAAETALQSMVASRKLIRTGQITVEVQSYEDAAREVARLAESLGGYLAESQASRGHQDRRAGTLTIRIPAERFAQAFETLKRLGKVQTENVGTQDVTKAYTDLETRLRVKRDTAERLREILKTRAAKLSEILEAERELARVTEEIEQMEGERRFYDQQVALSTITATLQEPDSVVKAGVFSPVGQAVRDSLEVLATSLAGLIYALVFVAPWLVVAFVTWRIVKAIRARRRAQPAKET
jgi:hypothetical protein